jgi:hypothetical protein
VRLLSFVLSFVLLASTAHAYTLVLRSGRRCDGDLIAQNQQTIQFRDRATGLVFSFKKQQIDESATAAANAVAATPAMPESSAADQPLTVAELARRLRALRTGHARVYTKEDLLHTPDVSIVGEEDSAGDSVPPPVSSGIGAGDERKWREEARRLRKELESVQDKLSVAAPACEKARLRRNHDKLLPHDHPLELTPLMHEPSECRHFLELQQRYEAARAAIDDFEERARHASIPWRWLE